MHVLIRPTIVAAGNALIYMYIKHTIVVTIHVYATLHYYAYECTSIVRLVYAPRPQTIGIYWNTLGCNALCNK